MEHIPVAMLSTWLKRYGRWLLLLLGLGAVVYLVMSLGAGLVLDALLAAGPWLPLVLALDLGWVVAEGFALLLLYGAPARCIPVRDWVQATLVQYVTMVVLPVGRAGAEVARATMMSKHVGPGLATASGALMQSLTLVSNALISVVCLLFVLAYTKASALSTLLAVNVAATLFLGGGLYLVMRRVKIGGFLGQKFESMAHLGPELDRHVKESAPRHPAAVLLCVLARAVQTAQYGVILLAVTGGAAISGMFVAQGIHLVGAGLGDMVPNQVGVTEGAYRIFAGALGLAEHPERAVAIALLARVSNLMVAGACAIAVQFLPKATVPEGDAAPAS